MQNTAPKGGAGSDDPTGRFCGRDRPVGHSDRSIVRTGSSNGRRIESCDDSLSSRSRSSSRRSCSCSPSTAIVPIGAVGAVLDCAVATGGANAGRNSGRKRGLAPRPDRPEAASRRDLSEKAVAGRLRLLVRSRWRRCLDPRRLTVRRQPNGRVRLSRAVRRRVRCWAERGRSR